MSKQDLAKEVKLIRQQLYNLNLKFERRENKLVELMLVLSPFFNVLAPNINKQIQELIGDDEN